MDRGSVGASPRLLGRIRFPRTRAVAWLGLVLAAILLAGAPHPVAAQLIGGVNVDVSASPTAVAVGQPVTFTYTARPPAVAPPFASITNITIDYGDGQTELGNTGGSGQTVSGSRAHVYTSSGSYTATVTAIASNGASNSAVANVFVGGGGGGQPPSVSITASPPIAQAGQPIAFSYSATTSFGIGFPQIRSILISYGDGSSPLPAPVPSGTVSRTYTNPGVYNVVITANDSNGQSGQNSTTVQITSAGTSGQPPVNVQILNQPISGIVGQAVPFSAATATTPNTGAFIQSYTWNYGDGGTTSGQATSHVYSAPGTYSAVLTVTDSTGVSAQANAQVSIAPSTPPSAPGISVTLQPGWNLVAAPTGTVLPPGLTPLFTWQPGDTAYQVQQATQTGLGYWAYAAGPTTITIPYSGGQTATRSLPPNAFIMIGNPGSTSATVTGANVVFVYNPATGYQQTTTLLPGQGAWALSNTGGIVTISGGPS